MSFDAEGRALEARALRAVAHPARLAILELLGGEDSATATQCAVHTGLSPSACSYHLRALARWGLVEEAEGGRGRQRPWRAKHSRIRVEEGALDGGTAAALAAEAFADLLLDRGGQWVRDFQQSRRRLPRDLRIASIIDNRTLTLTPQEARELWGRIDGLLDQFSARPEQPDGAVTYRWILRALPSVEAERIT